MSPSVFITKAQLLNAIQHPQMSDNKLRVFTEMTSRARKKVVKSNVIGGPQLAFYKLQANILHTLAEIKREIRLSDSGKSPRLDTLLTECTDSLNSAYCILEATLAL